MFDTTLHILVWLAAVLISVPLIVLVLECLAALLPARQPLPIGKKPRPSVAVVIPAHNEEAVIGQTLDVLQEALRPGDRVIVVADNCDDATAALARTRGATVVERNDTEKRGKGFALDAGVVSLQHDPPTIVVFLDADCTVQPDAIDHLVATVLATNRPAQGLYLMQTPDKHDGRLLISLFAFLVKNQVRPAGLDRFGMSVLITGSGFAVPWDITKKSPLANDDLVEDMNLGLDLIEAGHGPVYCPAAHIAGTLPQGQQAAQSQRTRWEHGHMGLLIARFPRLLLKGLLTLRLSLIIAALDLMVPPLSLLMFGACAVLGFCALGGWLTEHWIPLITMGATVLLSGLILLLVWAKFARDQLPLKALLGIPLYMLWKIPIYLRFTTKRQTGWVRTQRDA